MSAFVYFLPDRQAATAADLAEILPHAFDADGPATTCQCHKGPGGRPGITATPDPETTPSWRDDLHANPNGMPRGTWLIHDPDKPPGPDDLIRGEPIDGYPLTLGDGREWMIPLARVFPTGMALPSRLAIGPDGDWVKEPIPALRQASKDADRIWNAVRTAYDLLEDDESPTVIDEAETIGLAVGILALNYRIGAAEASALGLLTTANVVDVLRLFVDFPRFYEGITDAKKNAPTETQPGPPIDSGGPASPETTTDPPAQNSNDS